MKNIVILICSDFEWEVVTNNRKPENTEQSKIYGEWFIDEKHSDEKRQVIWFHGGWGKIASAGSAQYAIDMWNPELIINIGTCGGFEGKAKQNQIFLINKTVVYDMIDLFGKPGNSIKKLRTSINLSWLTDKTILKLPKALIATADQDLSPERIPYLNCKYGAVAGDWESGAIAWVAKRNNQNLLIIRGVSDVVSVNGNQAYTEDEKLIKKGMKTVMTKLIKVVDELVLRI